MDNFSPHEGRPGMPGEKGTGESGGAGGAGGVGGVGYDTGGAGGAGGTGGSYQPRGKPITGAIRWLTAATVGLYLSLAILGSFFYTDSLNRRNDIAKEANRTTLALCALRNDVQIRRGASIEFLQDHPQGIPGVSAKSIQISIDGQSRTLEAMNILHCD